MSEMQTVAVIQARLGASRLPGKVLFPLAGRPVIDHMIERASLPDRVDDVVVATSTAEMDSVVADRAAQQATDYYRGDEQDVLGRMHEAVVDRNPDAVVRICADSPLIDPDGIDRALATLADSDADYVSTHGDGQQVPRGLDVEVFSMSSFSTVEARATEPHEREHVTVAYRDDPAYETITLSDTEIFDDQRLHDAASIRLTLDEASDYRLLSTVYDDLWDCDPIDAGDAVEHVRSEGLDELNATVEQKSARRTD